MSVPFKDFMQLCSLSDLFIFSDDAWKHHFFLAFNGENKHKKYILVNLFLPIIKSSLQVGHFALIPSASCLIMLEYGKSFQKQFFYMSIMSFIC